MQGGGPNLMESRRVSAGLATSCWKLRSTLRSPALRLLTPFLPVTGLHLRSLYLAIGCRDSTIRRPSTYYLLNLGNSRVGRVPGVEL